MNTWINEIVNQHAELESPLSFWWWSGISAISATVKDNVWLPRQIYNLYPNIYVMFHAESGLKKGPPVSMARQLVTAVNNTKIIGGRSSIQGILKELGSTNQGYTTPGGKVVKPSNKSVAFICSSELSSSIVEDKVATKILTDLYDRQYNIGEWRSLLKMETFNLKDPTITMLTATNEAMTEDFFTRAAIQGGYFARTFIIYEKVRHRRNSLLVPLRNPPNYTKSADYLKELAKLNGPFEPMGKREREEPDWVLPMTDRTTNEIYWYTQAGLIYEEWYNRFLDEIEQHEIKDITGTLNRFGDSVLKVAMLMALSKEPKLVIDKESMKEAIDQCERLVGNIRQTTHAQTGLSPTKSLKWNILKELYEREPHQITRSVLMKKLWLDYGDVNEFSEMMNSLEHAGMVRMEQVGNNILYTMPDTQVSELKRYFAGKIKK